MGEGRRWGGREGGNKVRQFLLPLTQQTPALTKNEAATRTACKNFGHLRVGEKLGEVPLEARQGVNALRPRAVQDKPHGPQVVLVAKHEDHRLVKGSVPNLFRGKQ